MDEQGREELLVRSLPRTPENLLGMGVDCDQSVEQHSKNLFLHLASSYTRGYLKPYTMLA